MLKCRYVAHKTEMCSVTENMNNKSFIVFSGVSDGRVTAPLDNG